MESSMSLAPTLRIAARVGALCVAMVPLIAACSADPEAAAFGPSASLSPAAHHGGGTALTSEQLRAIARVRQATARFHDPAAARAAGYTVQYPAGCAYSDAGAQGIHYLNAELAKDAVVDVLRPELVMYEPQRDGSLQFVGVDYVIPFSQWTSDAAPTVLGVPMMRNEPLGVWAVHIWAWRPNPSGMFGMWNPNVSCALAR
jgi:hypothetical protein